MGGSFKLNCSDWRPADLSWGHKSKWKGKNFIPEFHPKYFSQQWKYKDFFSFILNIFFAGFPWTLRRCDSCFCPSQTARNVGFKTVLTMHQLSKHLKGQLDPPVSDVTLFAPKEVGWIPLSVTWRFLHQVGAPRLWHHVFCTKGVPLSLSVDAMCWRNEKKMLQNFWSSFAKILKFFAKLLKFFFAKILE